jgi:putative ABC transport system permease protein
MSRSLDPRWRKVLRDLGSNRARTVLVVLSIAVGVFAVGAIMSTSTVLNHDLSEGYLASRPASASLFTDRPFDEDLVRLARHVEGVADTTGIRSATVRVKVGANDWRQLQLTARDDFPDMRLDKIEPERGAWPPERHELALERASLSIVKAGLADTLTIETPDGKQHELRIGGVVHDIGAPPSIFTGEAYGYVTLETLDWLHISRGYTRLDLTVAEHPLDKAHIQQVAGAVKRKIEQGSYAVLQVDVPAPGEHPANEVLQPLLLILGALGTFSLFLSGFLVVNTITALLTQQVPQIGVMKAIGARTGQVLGMYLATVLVYGGMAFVVAAPLASAGGYALAGWMAGLLNVDLQGFRAPVSAVMTEAAIALLVPLLAALWPIAGGARISVREALSAQGRNAFGTGHVDKLIERLRGVSLPVLLSLRNTFRRKGRLALTLTTLTLGGAIFVAVLSLQASLMKTLDVALEYWQYDVEVSFVEPYRIDRIVEEAKQVPGVAAAESWVMNPVQRQRPDGHDGPSVSLIGVPADTKMIDPVLVDGRWLTPDDDDAIILNTDALKHEPDLKVGDSVVFKIGKKETTWRVVGIVRASLSGPTAYAAFPTVARHIGSQGRANRVQVVMRDHSPAAQAAAATALKEHFDDSAMKVSKTETIASIREGVGKQFNIIVGLMAMMAVLMAVVGGLGLMGTMGINVLERSREIGVLRAIGASTGAMLRIVLAEGLLIGALSWVAGAALSLPMSKLMADAIGQSLFNARLDFRFSLAGAALWLAIVLALAALASLLPALRAARITVREVLAYE